MSVKLKKKLETKDKLKYNKYLFVIIYFECLRMNFIKSIIYKPNKNLYRK